VTHHSYSVKPRRNRVFWCKPQPLQRSPVSRHLSAFDRYLVGRRRDWDAIIRNNTCVSIVADIKDGRGGANEIYVGGFVLTIAPKH
jgi:hypothetical protein